MLFCVAPLWNCQYMAKSAFYYVHGLKREISSSWNKKEVRFPCCCSRNRCFQSTAAEGLRPLEECSVLPLTLTKSWASQTCWADLSHKPFSLPRLLTLKSVKIQDRKDWTKGGQRRKENQCCGWEYALTTQGLFPENTAWRPRLTPEEAILWAPYRLPVKATHTNPQDKSRRPLPSAVLQSGCILLRGSCLSKYPKNCHTNSNYRP